MTIEIAMPKPSGEPVVKSPQFNDRDRINDILMTVKYLTAGFNTGLNEMQNPALHRTIRETLIDLHDMQFELFNRMFENGWYKMKAADQKEVTKTHKQFEKYNTQFPSFD
jgi:spore coat protein CotF